LTQWLVLLVGLLGFVVVLLNLIVISKLNNGNFKKFANMTLLLILIFSVAGFLRSLQVFSDVYTIANIPIAYVEYGIYSIVYIVAAFKIYSISKTFGFAE
ncbi:MAG: hypothetical protein P1P69_09405, partial [Methanosarcinaceae archaeon]|nr:hypothetical protein [Methanosarcinaceae archaeon]